MLIDNVNPKYEEAPGMPNPSPLHDPMAKLFFPLAPIVPQLRSAAEHDRQYPDQYGYSWTSLLSAAADRIEELEKRK